MSIATQTPPPVRERGRLKSMSTQCGGPECENLNTQPQIPVLDARLSQKPAYRAHRKMNKMKVNDGVMKVFHMLDVLGKVMLDIQGKVLQSTEI